MATGSVSPAPHPPTPPGRPEGPGHRAGAESAKPRGEMRIALIGAIATIVAALIGGFAIVKSGAVEVNLPSDGPDREELETTVSSLELTNDSLETTNSSLQEALDEATSTTSTTPTTADDGTTGVTTSPTPLQSEVLRETGTTPLTFSWRYSADLDSTDPNWNVQQGTPSGEDLYVNSGGQVYAGEVTLMDHVATEAECRDATVRQSSLPEDMSVAGTMFCMETDSDHWAFVHIVALDSEARTASFDVTVWQ